MKLLDTHQYQDRLCFLDCLLIVVFALGFHLYRLGSVVPLSDHEGLVAVTATETLEGNWIVPHFDGQIRLQKTPLMYWAVAGLGKIAGGINEFVVRLPSAFSATGVALLMAILAARMFGRVSGIITGLAVAGSVGILWQSHRGIADMMMTFFVVGSFVSFYFALENIREGKSGLRYMVLAYIAFGLGMLAKGPVPAPVVIFPLALYLILTGEWREWRKFHLVLGVLICLIIVGGWVLPVLSHVGNAVWRWKAEYISRFTGGFAEASKRPWYYYVPLIFLFGLPWTIFLPTGLTLPFNNKLKDKKRELLYIFLWFVCGFIFFSASEGKRSHYLLPVLPPAILLSVAGMIYALEIRFDRKFIFRASQIIIVGSFIAFFVGYWMITTYLPGMAFYYLIICSLMIASEIIALELYLRVNLMSAVTVTALTAGIVFAVVWPLVPRVEDHARDPVSAAQKINESTEPDADIYFIGRANAHLIYYAKRRMPQIPDSQDIVEILKSADRKGAKQRLVKKVIDRVAGIIRQNKRIYFITSGPRYPLLKSWTQKRGEKIYEILRIPRYFSRDKGLVLFSNKPPAKFGKAGTPD